MLPIESEWLGEKLVDRARKGEGFPLLNIGSSTLEFRTLYQPYVHNNIFGPLEKLGAKVYHSDIKEDNGVDIVGDLSNKAFVNELKNRSFGGVLCSNLLEHVVNREEICKALIESVQPGGIIVVTVPHLFPYHSDPIDTMFRPGIGELKKLFPDTVLEEGVILKADRCQFDDWLKSKKMMAIVLTRLLLPFYKFKSWKSLVSDLPNLFKNYEVTCVILRKV